MTSITLVQRIYPLFRLCIVTRTCTAVCLYSYKSSSQLESCHTVLSTKNLVNSSSFSFVIFQVRLPMIFMTASWLASSLKLRDLISIWEVHETLGNRVLNVHVMRQWRCWSSASSFEREHVDYIGEMIQWHVQNFTWWTTRSLLNTSILMHPSWSTHIVI